MQPFGSNNFFRLMSSLDEENINPLRGEGAIALKGQSLETTIQALAPAISRVGIDLSEFQRKAATSLIELPRAWREFIRTEAKKVLSGDMDRLLVNIHQNFEKKSIKSSEINAIVHFVLSYYEVIHRRSINKKEVIEGVLMRGLVKKSSFYAKISSADKAHHGVLTWDDALEQADDLWRHFTLQTLRFLKQAIFDMEDYLDNSADIKARLQEIIDREERDQFNGASGHRMFANWLPLMLFLLGVGGLMFLPHDTSMSPNATPVASSHQEVSFDDGLKSKDFAQPLNPTLLSANLQHIQPVSVDREAVTVGLKK